MTLEELLDSAGDQAHRILIGTKEELIPTFVLVQPNNEMVLVACPWNGDREKEALVFAVKQYMRNIGTVSYSFLTEAWAAKADKDWKPNDPLRLRPSQDPNREEIGYSARHRRCRNTVSSLADPA